MLTWIIQPERIGIRNATQKHDGIIVKVVSAECLTPVV